MSTIAREDALVEASEFPGRGIRMSEAEFLALDGVHAEWVDGYTFLMSPVSVEHDDLRNWLMALLVELCDEKNIGRVHGEPFVARLSEKRVRSPDLMFIANESLGRLEKNLLNGAPDMVIEIVSPEGVDRDYDEKFEEYQRAGVREYWIIDPLTHTFVVQRLSQAGVFEPVARDLKGRVYSAAAAGFFFDVQWLRAHLPKLSQVRKEMGI